MRSKKKIECVAKVDLERMRIAKGDTVFVTSELYDKDHILVHARRKENHKYPPYWEDNIAPKGSFKHLIIINKEGIEWGAEMLMNPMSEYFEKTGKVIKL